MPTYQAGLDITLPEGIYDFVVADANDKRSQSGNEMIELQLIIKGPDGQEVRVYDNLVFTDRASWKIDQFRVCTGDVLIKGQSVDFNVEDCLDRSGKCNVVIEEFGGRARNKVGEYLDPAAVDNSQAPEPAAKPVPKQPQQTARPQPAPVARKQQQASLPIDDEIPMN